MIENKKTNVALDNIFEELVDLLEAGTRVPMTEKILINEVEISSLIDDLKEAIPKEIKSATQVLEEQKNIVNKAYEDADRIVAQAKADAERIVGVAQAKADAMIQQEEIVQQAVAVAEEIKANALRYQEETHAAADEYSLRIKQDSLQYADDMLAFISNNLQSALQDVQDSRKNVIKALDEVNNHLPPQPEEEIEQYEEEQ